MRRLLMVTSSYPAGPHDFRAGFVRDMAEAMLVAGHDVTIVTPANASGPGGIGRCLEAGVEVVRFATPGLDWAPLVGDGGMPYLLNRHPQRAALVPGWVLSLARAIRRAVERVEPDGILAHWLLPTGPAVLLAGLDAVPTGFIAHGTDVRWLSRLPGGGALARRLAESGSVLATSVRLQKELADLGVSAVVAPVGVVGKGIGSRPSPAVFGKAHRRPVEVRMMGRFVKSKNMELVAEVALAAPHFRFQLAGDGPSRGKVEAAIRTSNVEDRVVCVGPLLSEAKRQWLAQGDIFMHLASLDKATAVYENLPVSIVEALAAGLPVVATAAGSISEIVDERCGVLFDSLEPAAIAEALHSLTGPQCQRLAMRALEVGQARSWANVLPAFVQPLREVRAR